MQFINYQQHYGATVSASRNNGTSCGDDVVEFVRSAQRGETVTMTVHESVLVYMDTMIDALNDDALTHDYTWESVYSALELILIDEFED